MIKKLVLLFLLTTSLSNGQELMNFYLEPSTTNDVIDLHTLVYDSGITYFDNYSISIIDNNITIALCYLTTSLTAPTFDYRVFNIELPEGYSSYSITIELFGDGDGAPCTNTNLVEIGTLAFNPPYNPIATSTIPDDVFEGYLEDIGFGDDIENNDLVFNHRIVNLRNLFMSDFTEDIISLEGLYQFINLKELHCSNNSITEIDVSTSFLLERLYCGFNPINQLNITNNPILNDLLCVFTNITSLNVTNNVELEFLNIGYNNISDINLSQNINLFRLNFSGNKISAIDLSNNILLQEINGSYNLLSYIDISNNSNLERFYCPDNNLTSVDLSNIPNLKNVLLFNNQITDLDFSNNSLLEVVLIFTNNLSSLNLKNGNNANITSLSAGNNDDLYCVDVDNPDEAPYPGWSFDSQVVFSEDCTLGIEDVLTTQISLFPNPAQDLLIIENNSNYLINSIQISDILGKLIQETSVNIEDENKVFQMNISNLKSGLYLINIETDLGHVIKKVIKN